MNKNQEIVPVQLRDEKKKMPNRSSKTSPQKLIARLKSKELDLFIYEGIREPVLKVLLMELYQDEDC